ncbi:hypothetical protein B0A50_06425 [Salinomyces thailandicus]|uniref:Mediator of RNA polymerase II transcription subunit 12 n=1 Tax=Salinomyces thailandicus TaxID=706561 RepID=A0A4U0TPF3_9PEZI|nr:hypothetical protein B0A50_06425 [Salinomyces thailandica]
MDNHQPTVTTSTAPRRSLPPQRAVSGSALQFPKPHPRSNFPSRLSNVRSISQPTNTIDLTLDAIHQATRHNGALIGDRNNTVGSPGVIEVQDGDGERPAKRAKTGEDSPHGKENEHGSRDRAHAVVDGDALPNLPRPHGAKTQTTVHGPRRRGRELATRKSNGLESPPIATRLPPPKNTADFAPWTGHHPEDQLNEAVIKSGYCDKGSGPHQNECNSAKPAIWQNLTSKNNMGLQTLSYLFTQVMEKRQVLGKCTATSTFKPPPRVTVTDTKREAWLRDLANLDVPLRKQSRTIPHGIRGKLLMDQCLSKNIPLQRAIWLAKCVGANELRAFRRRGVSGAAAASGEAKWVREWTVHVEQFLESVIAACGQHDWQLKMNYAIKLAAGFYAEHLLDAEHYLDWIVASFHGASMETLPIWIAIVQLHWEDVVRFTRRGRRLVNTILMRLHNIGVDGAAMNEALKLRLQKLIAILATTNRGCLVIPQTWKKHKPLLLSAMETQSTSTSIIDNIAKRNERLSQPLSNATVNTKSPLLGLYAALDAVDLQVDAAALTRECQAAVPEVSSLVPALLDWATSLYRYGSARIYLAARLINNLHDGGDDTDTSVLAYLSATTQRSRAQIDNLYLVVAELLRLGGFAVGRYMQWLMSSGKLYAGEISAVATGLLACLPVACLPAHIVGLRRTLLDRIEVSKNLSLAVSRAVRAFEAAIADPNAVGDFADVAQTAELPVKLALAQHATAQVPRVLSDGELQPNAFCVVRSAFESVPDVPALANLVESAAFADDTTLLATVADTITMHATSFAALDRLQSLTDRLIERYTTLRFQQPLDRTFILALTTLAKRQADKQGLISLLASDLGICEQQNSVAMCSPASDSVTGMYASSLESDNDIDAVFASGNSMDDQLLHRVFVRLVQRASNPVMASLGLTSKLSAWFNQLSVLGGSTFDQLAANYTRSMLKSASGEASKLAAATIAIVASNCAPLNLIVNMARENASSHAVSVALRVLLDSQAIDLSLSAAEQYRFTVMQQDFCRRSPETVVELLCKACGAPDFVADSNVLTELLVAYAVTQRELTSQIFRQTSQDATSLANVGRLAGAVVARGNTQLTGTSLAMQDVISSANPLSVTVCTGALEHLTKVRATQDGDGEAAIKEVLVDAIEKGSEVWSRMLDAIGGSVKRALHDWAEEQLFLTAAPGDMVFNADTERIVGRYLDVLDVTRGATVDRQELAEPTALVEKLREADRRMSTIDLADTFQLSTKASATQALEVLLHICAARTGLFEFESESSATARGNLVSALCALSLNPIVQVQPNLAEYVLDTVSLLADSLSEPSLTTIARSLGVPKTSDLRIQSILGATACPSNSTWLALASQPHPHHLQGTQQQRALAKHASQHQQQPNARSGVASNPSTAGPSSQQRTWLPGTPTSTSSPSRPQQHPVAEWKTQPYPLRSWEIMADATPVMGENEASVSLCLFGARKVL